MKRTIFFAVFIAATQLSFARSANNDHPCNYNDSTLISIAEAQQMLSEIMSVVGLQANFELKEANVLNIEASISHKKRYILYNPSFINQINSLTKNKWGAIALLAHEVGHHLNGHTIRKTGSKPELELEADEFAGFILHKLGASLEQAQEVIRYIAKTEASSTHPGRIARMLAIQKGWNKIGNAEVAAIQIK
jgi:hypothetical protein